MEANLHQSATGRLVFRVAQDTRQGKLHGAGEFVATFVDCELLQTFINHTYSMPEINSLVMIGTFGLYLEIKRAVFPLVESTRIALALCS